MTITRHRNEQHFPASVASPVPDPGRGRIERGSNWGYWDQLHGQSLHDGEMLRVWFPDGSTVDTIKVVHHSQGVSYGMEIFDARAYMEDRVRFVDVLVPLFGLDAERIRRDVALAGA